MFKTIGKKVERVDGYEKVTGKAIYGDDLIFPGMLHAVCRYADISCGKIIRIDVNPAREIREVAAVIVHDDIPGSKFLGPIRADQSPLVKNRVNFQGDVIAVVAADSKEKALKAAEMIKVEYEPEAGIFDPLEAVKPEAKLVHPQYKSNVVVHYPLRKGNINKGFIESDKVITRTYRTGFAEHAYLEPETVTAVPDPVSRGVKIFGSIQNPFTSRRIIAQFLGFDLNRVNVLSSTLGGSFGGKDDIVNMMACRCALLALKTNKPVKLTNSREASLRESYKRHPYVMTYKAGFTNDGKLRAMEIDIIADSGAYSSQSFFVTWRSVVQA
ncbi:MAG: molybdopterin-dependent oxidoreductase, partial [Candidatus Cloacimonetes bacterium]|nr:molybdopterin-dependent oxidoreductase [Candidatus Cloacimonadota bacterium]